MTWLGHRHAGSAGISAVFASRTAHFPAGLLTAPMLHLRLGFGVGPPRGLEKLLTTVRMVSLALCSTALPPHPLATWLIKIDLLSKNNLGSWPVGPEFYDMRGTWHLAIGCWFSLRIELESW